MTAVERLGLQRLLSQPGRMILRHIERRPLKAALSVVGIAFAGGIVIAGTFFLDAIDFMVEVEFRLAQREDLVVGFTEPTSRRVSFELASLPGVTRVEPYRAVSVRLRHGPVSRRSGIQGLAPGAVLHRVLDTSLSPVAMPTGGLLLSQTLGEVLQVRPGDHVVVEVLQGRRAVLDVPVTGLVAQYVGTGAYMDLDALNRLLGEGDALSGAFLEVDPSRREAVYARLKEAPRVAGVQVHESMIQSYYSTIGELLLTFVSFIAGLSAAITLGVVYNSARITLSERARELASLRVLGYTRGEIAYILLGELALLVLAAIPLGFVVGAWLAWRFAQLVPQELFRIPLVLEPRTFALSALVVIVATLISGMIVRRRIDRLDLIAVLKTKE